jgi:hypothetical protein
MTTPSKEPTGEPQRSETLSGDNPIHEGEEIRELNLGEGWSDQPTGESQEQSTET